MDLEHKDTTGDKHAYHLGKQLTTKQQHEICDLMNSYSDVLAVSFDELRQARVRYQHHINTKDAKPIKQAPYRLAPHYK